MDEQALSAAFPTGDEETLAAAINAYGHALLRYCHHVLCDYHEAQDAVQIAFCKAYAHRARFVPGTSLKAWLYRLCYTTCVDLLRARKRQLFVPPPAPRVDTDYIGPALRAALERLTAQERALVFSRVMEGQSYDDLASIYGKSAATLRKRYERAKKKLALALTEIQREQEATYELRP